MSEENTMNTAKSDPSPSSIPPWAFASPSTSNRIHKRKISSPLEGIPAQHRPFMSSPTLKGYTSPTTNGEEFGSSMVFSFSSALPPISPSTRSIAVARRPSSPINHRILRSTARKQLRGEKDEILVPATIEQSQDQAIYTTAPEQTPTSFTLPKNFSLEFKPSMSPSTSTTIAIANDQFTSTSSTPNTSRVPSPFRGVSPFRAIQDDSNMSDTSSSGSDTPPIISFRRHRRSISNPIPSTSKRKEMLVGSGGLGGGVVYKSSGRRNSLRPKAKSLARILSQLESDSHPLESEIHHEHEITSHLKHPEIGQHPGKDGDVDMSMAFGAGVSGSFSASGSSDEASSTSPSVAMSLSIFRENSFSSSVPSAPSTPAAISISSTPFFQENTYQYTRMNPEMEINMSQSDIAPSSTNQIVSSWTSRLKRKASEDRFEPYLNSNLKRRAVSPSVNPSSATNSPTLSAIPASPSLPPVFPTSSPTSTSRNKNSSHFNIQDASGGFSKMSLK